MMSAVLGVGATILLAVIASTYHLGGRLARIETRWEERERSAMDRRESWMREAEERARAARKADLAEHAATCPGRAGRGNTDPAIQRYTGPIAGDTP